ncbi:MAG: RNA-directed DNA polymerase [Alistipes sp.]|nr:RNA-directed DNA polymerase [Alistipes sp.]
MKRIGNLMPQILATENLLNAYYNARKGKSHKEPVVKFSKNIFENIIQIRDSLRDGSFRLGRYHYFNIYDPKLRVICAASFEERILHHAIMNVCKPYFERNFIFDTYASREGKGIYAAINRARVGMRRYEYVAKLDVRKYFDSIPHNLLRAKLRRVFKDAELLSLFDRIIDSYCVVSGRGIPIGNLTSQYFANFYLSSLDHYVKEGLGVPLYVRYMDDMLLFGHSREAVRAYVEKISQYVDRELKLSIKPPLIEKSVRGVIFLGYLLSRTKILLSRRSKVRFKGKMSKYDKLLVSGVWTEAQYLQHITPLLAFVRVAYTKQLRAKVCSEN